jgi:drug/metabolite transporter (DMT)-like permease
VVICLSTTAIAYVTLHSHPHRSIFLFFYLDAEQNIPSFFSSCLLLLAALLLSIITLIEKDRLPSPVVLKWKILSVGLLLMATDEIVSLHERLVGLRKVLFDLLGNDNFRILSITWVFSAIPIIIFIIVFFRSFLHQLPPITRRTFLLAAILYLGGCVGVELLGVYHYSTYGTQNLVYYTLVTIEEGLEMLGVIVFIHGLLKYITLNYKRIQLTFNTID